MADYILSCCSTADLSKEHFEHRDIHYICFHFTSLTASSHPDDLGQTMPFEKFYARHGTTARRPAPPRSTSEEFVDYFTPFLAAGKGRAACHAVLRHLGCVSTPPTPPETICHGEAIPAAKCYVVDSLGASSGYGLSDGQAGRPARRGHGRWTSLRLGARSTGCTCTTGSSPPTSRSTSRAGASPRPPAGIGTAAGHLPAAEHGQPGPSDSPAEDPRPSAR